MRCPIQYLLPDVGLILAVDGISLVGCQILVERWCIAVPKREKLLPVVKDCNDKRVERMCGEELFNAF